MEFDAFSHSQIHSKVWLSEKLEPYLKPKSKIVVLGCWYNVMGMILMIRNPHLGLIIKGIDIDQDSINYADQLTTAWRYEFENPFNNECADANNYNLGNYDIVINCSVEHMQSDDWFKNIPSGKIVCLQSMDINITNDPIYKITNPNTSVEEFIDKFKMAKTLFLDSKKFNYPKNSFTRFCHIGYK